MVEADDRNAVTAGGTSDRDGAAEVEAAVVIALDERDRVGMDGGDDIGARCEVLGGKAEGGSGE
jgi:hypothetical protein